MEIVGNMAPDIMGAFNGGSFDWPLYRAQVTRCGLLTKLKSKFSSLPLTKSDTEISVLKWCFKKASVKIDAETKHDLECVANFPGLLDTDVLPVFLKMYPRAEVRKGGSLNFFLSKNNLESKEDMPYKRMFKIYERSVKLMNIKSCHCGTAQSLCACCKEVVPSIDCHEIEPEIYNDELLPGLEKCCFCGKKPQNAIDMGNVGYYCVVDCVRPQQLYVKRMIIPDKRELSNMSYVALHDSFYRADGMKVCNLIGAYCFKRGVAFSNARVHKTKEEKDHYPGAWVFPPNRGLHSDQMMDIDMLGPDGTIITVRKRGRPITGLDFASLYPSLMMTYNLSPDMVVYDHDVALMLETEGYTIHHIKPFNYEVGEEKGKAENKKKTAQGWTVRHNGIFNPKDEEIVTSYVKHETYNSEGLSKPIKYQSEVGPTVEQQDTISKLAAEGKKINRKVTYEPIRGRKKLPGERMGIFPFIVKKLFDKRVPIKAEFVRLEKLLEEMNLQGVKTLIIDGRTVTYKDISFEKNKVDSKQKALKVLANTFYGKSGDYTSAIYELLVAAGITTAGQENIKRVAKFVTDRGFTVNYGDSVTADTPILIKTTSEQIDYWEIRELASYWKPYGDKEVSDCNAYAWSDQGWTKINRVIRHRTTKNIYRVLTHTGCVDVTSDHSLLDSQAKKIRPTDVNVGTKLLHADLPITDITYPIDDTKIANASLYHFMSSTGDIMEVDSNSAVANIKADPETANNVVSVTNLGPTEEYVYDLETENHHFAAGVGRLIVHNTDSVYVSCPDDVYAKCDNEYETAMADIHTQFAGIENIPEPVPNTAEAEYKLARTRARIVWWTEQVSITMKLMTQINEQVADHLLANNGTVFLKTAYEEVGFPSGFCGKKKYFLTAHIENINFYPKDIFIRGIDIVKQGQAKISKQLGEEFMREVLAPENERTMMDFAEDKIRKYYRTALDIALFTLNARYRPDKQNVAVRIFVDRMKEAQKRATDPILKAIFEPPEAGDKFEYIVVKKEQRYTLQGTKVELKKGDLMEYPRVYTASQNSASPMCIDLDYYMKGQVAGIFARFIAYHPMFQPPKGMFDISDKDGYQDMDKYCVNKAKKYIAKICDSITGCDPAALTAQGADYRKIYNRADKQIRIDVGAKYGNMKFILCDLPDRSVWSNNEGNSNAYSSQIIAHMKALASVYRSNIGARYIEINTQRKLFSVFELRRIYSSDNGIGKTRVRMYDRKETEIVESLYQYMPDLLELLQTYNKNIAEVIEDAKRERDTDIEICESDLDSINNFDTHELAIITKVYKLFVELQCVYQSRADILSTMSAIELERARIMNTHIEPVINIIAEARSESKAAEVLGEYEWS
jgi:DNA polymerase elongation subunit (family B)